MCWKILILWWHALGWWRGRRGMEKKCCMCMKEIHGAVPYSYSQRASLSIKGKIYMRTCVVMCACVQSASVWQCNVWDESGRYAENGESSEGDDEMDAWVEVYLLRSATTSVLHEPQTRKNCTAFLHQTSRKSCYKKCQLQNFVTEELCNNSQFCKSCLLKNRTKLYLDLCSLRRLAEQRNSHVIKMHMLF